MGNDMKIIKLMLVIVFVMGVLVGVVVFLVVEEKIEFKLVWFIYVGWMFWGYFEDSGIMDKWVDKYGIDVEIVQFNDYVELIN